MLSEKLPLVLSEKLLLVLSARNMAHKEEGTESSVRERQPCQIKARWVLKILEWAAHTHTDGKMQIPLDQGKVYICYKCDTSNPYLAQCALIMKRKHTVNCESQQSRPTFASTIKDG